MHNSRNQNLIQSLVKLVKIYLLLLLVMTGFRCFFVGYFGSIEVLEQNLSDLFFAFFLGWKYDTIVISYLITPVYFISVLSSLIKNDHFHQFKNIFYQFYFLISFILITSLLISDMGFYSYFQDHLNILFYGFFEDDTKALFQTMEKNYPFKTYLFIYAISIGLFFWCIRKILKPRRSNFLNAQYQRWYSYPFVVLFSFILLVGGLRGGYGELVISPQYSDFSQIEFINQVSINGVITFERAMKLRATRNNADANFLKLYGYKNIKEALFDFNSKKIENEQDFITLITRKTPLNEVARDNPPHVIVLLMESFGAHWLQFNSSEFNFLGDLKKHFDEDFYFKRFVSSDNGTIGSLMSLATNIPNRRGARFLSESKYMQMPLSSSAHIPFQKAGYNAQFYYGGKLGWRDIGKYFRYQGWDELKGENLIRSELKLDGKVGTEWGLYDEHLFQSIYKQIENAESPQVIFALSTTNHPPFEVPSSYKSPELKIPEVLDTRINREKDIFKERFKAFEYTNQKLAEFIEKVKSSPLRENTIIAVTGDHNFWGFINYSHDEAFLKHTVPFYLYIPKNLSPTNYNPDKPGSHKDIFTTLYHLALSESEYISFGNDLFSENQGYAFNNSIIANNESVEYKGKFYSWKDDSLYVQGDQREENKTLLKKYQSTISVADYLLQYLNINK